MVKLWIAFLGAFAVLSSSPASGQGLKVFEVDKILGTSGIFGPLKVMVPTTFGESSISDAVSKFSSLLQVPGTLDAAYSSFAAKFGGHSTPNAKNVFKSNVLNVFGHNLKADKGMKSYTLGVNQFSDLTLDEVRAKYTGALVPNVTRRDLFLEETPTKLPVLSLNHRLQARADASKDWRQYGVVTTPKNQGGCGSCTDFAVTGGLEAAMGLYKGVKNLDLSEQELVDCPTGNGVARCSGNWPEDIYDYQKNQGQTTEAQYPYEAKEGSCRASGKSKPARISNWYRAPNSGDENQLKEWVSTYGPHSVVIEVNNAFQSYRGGVMDSPCSNTRYDHSVLVVGYGSENGKDFWIVKNSWGTGYGEKGYIRMARNKGNLCRIADYGILPQA